MKNRAKKILALICFYACVGVYAQQGQNEITISARFVFKVTPNWLSSTPDINYLFSPDGRLTVISRAGIHYAIYRIIGTSAHVTWNNGVTSVIDFTDRSNGSIGLSFSTAGATVWNESGPSGADADFFREQLRIGYTAANAAKTKVEGEAKAKAAEEAKAKAEAEAKAKAEREEEARLATLPVSITIVNNTGKKIRAVYIGRSGNNSSGPNRISSTGALDNDQEITFQVPRKEIDAKSDYDVLLYGKCGYIICHFYVKRNVKLTHENRFVFTKSDKR